MEARIQVRERKEEEEEEVVGIDLKTRKRSHSQSHHTQKLHTVINASSTNSDGSITSESSENSFEYFLSMKTDTNGTGNGQNSGIIEGGSVSVHEEAVAEVEGPKEENLEEPRKEEDEIIVDSNDVSFSSTHEGINGISLHQNVRTVTFSLPDGDVGNQESTPSSSSLSKSPDTSVGLKYFESLLDESSNNLNFAATDVYNALEDTLNNAPKSVENENDNLNSPNLIPEVQEIDVERVIQKQVFTLDSAPKSVENEKDNLSPPKDSISEIQEIDVERVIQKQVFTLDCAPKSVENENGHLGLPKGLLPEVEEFDVERVIQKQETHDFYCPNCNSCITKRVILKRRKRKIQEISAGRGEDARRSSPAQPALPPYPDGIHGEIRANAPASVDRGADEPIYAITCLSCFSIFLPTQNGWLRRIFGRKPEVPAQPDASLTEPLVPTQGGDASIDATIDDGKGHMFPLWIVNCCQPSEKRPVNPDMSEPKPEPEPEPRHPESPLEDKADLRLPKPDTEPPQKPPDGAEGSEDKPKPYLPIADETTLPPEPEPPAKPGTHPYKPIVLVTSKPEPPVEPGTHPFKPIAPLTPEPRPTVPDDNKPLLSETKPDSGKPVPPETKPDSEDMPNRDGIKRPSLLEKPDAPLHPKPEPAPDAGVDSLLTSVPKLPTELDRENGFALWFVNCCQPQRDGPRLPGKSGIPLPTEPEPLGDAELPSKPAPTPVQDTPLPLKPLSPIAPADGIPSPPTPINVTRPDGDTPLLPKPTPPTTPNGAKPLPPVPKHPDITVVSEPKTPAPPGQLIIAIPDDEEPTPAPSMTTSNDTQPEPGPYPDIETPLLDDAQGHPRPREGTGVDIIKAIVYGGLLECITSLSVISSAAGGDATTLNIVALGLANMFGGLMLLFHNLRVLKHEHGTERYIQLLGQPGHFLLHATIAVISYLVFGLMAPIIYGFSYRKSDNKDYKLITLAAASLACITVLSTAKAYVRSPPRAYIQTVCYYVSLGAMVSGVAYVAGDLINMLLKKLGLFDSTSAAPEAGDMKGVWASY